MRLFILAAILALSPISAGAENPTPYSGMTIVKTGQPFGKFVQSLGDSIKANKMGLVAQACAHCGAKSIGVTIPENRVFMIFRPDFAVRMLEASEAAGIEAPLRL